MPYTHPVIYYAIHQAFVEPAAVESSPWICIGAFLFLHFWKWVNWIGYVDT